MKTKDAFSLTVMPRRAAVRLGLGPFPAPLLLATGLAAPTHRRPHPPHRVEDQFVDVLDHMENAQLVVRVGPQFGQHGRVEIRAIGDHDLGLEPPGSEVLEEPQHMVLIVGGDQGEGDRQVRERVGGQEQGEAAQVEFVDAEGAAEVLEHLAAMSGHVESRGEVVEHVVDEPRGEIEEELALERQEDPFDAHAVFEDALQHQIPDLVVVLGLGEDILGCGAEGGGAVAAGLVLAVGDLQEGDGLVGDGANGSCQGPLASTEFAAGRTRGFLGSAVNRYNERCGYGYIRAHACVLGDEVVFQPHSRRTQALSFKPKTAYHGSIAWWGSARSVEN